MKQDDAAKMAAVAVLSGGLTFGGTHLLQEEYDECLLFVEHEARHKEQECAIKLMDCENNLGGNR